MKLSIVIPVYNSETSLRKLHKAIKKAVHTEHEIIYVNDASKDESAEILSQLEEAVVINLEENTGQQGAIFEGLKVARGDYIVTMDDDLQHDPGDILRLLVKIEEGYDLVYGVSSEAMVNYRQVGSKLTAKFFKHRYPHLKDKRVSSFRIFTRAMNQEVIRCPYKFIYLSGIMLGLTDNVGQVMVVKRKRLYGTSGYDFKKLVWLFLRLNFYYGYLPEFMKPKRKNNEKNYDVRCGQLSTERH